MAQTKSKFKSQTNWDYIWDKDATPANLNATVEIEVKVELWGTHQWLGAEWPVEILKFPHLHKFVFRCRKLVTHADRDIEFFVFAQEIKDHLTREYRPVYDKEVDRHLQIDWCGFGPKSCEQLACDLMAWFDLTYCSVHEDDQHGAIVRRLTNE